jgi:hypothetical protein
MKIFSTIGLFILLISSCYSQSTQNISMPSDKLQDDTTNFSILITQFNYKACMIQWKHQSFWYKLKYYNYHWHNPCITELRKGKTKVASKNIIK